MGRTNPRLVPFLKEGLEMKCFMNLRYETENIFYIELPRFDKGKCKCEEYEIILKAWYKVNGKLKKYLGYSNGKSVFQAALKKSVYLISLPNIGKRLRFRFATPEEVKENRRLLKEKEKRKLQPLSPSSDPPSSPLSNPPSSPLSNPPSSPLSNPPSVASSGYLSGSDCEAESMHTVDICMPVASSGYSSGNDCKGENMQTEDICMPDDFLDDVLKHPEYYIGDGDDLFSDIVTHDVKVESPPLQNVNPYNRVPHQVMQSEVFESMDKVPEFIRPVRELKPTPVGNFGSEKKYWLCTQKVQVKGTLQLICEMQVVEDENSSGIIEGSVVIPNDVFEPGVSYKLHKSFELNDLQYYFFTKNSM